MTPFGTGWEALTLDVLREFFSASVDEGLTWEAKGTAIRPEQVRRAASAFGNSVVGGYMVLGVGRPEPGASWVISGYAFSGEPETWVSTCVMNDGVRPRPPMAMRTFAVDDERHVVVVRFDPVAVPPVITAEGQVWERLSGLSQQITDPASLRRLIERGETAQEQARKVSVDAREDLRRTPAFGRECSLILALASPAMLGDVSAEFFRQSAYEEAAAILDGPLAGFRPGGLRLDKVTGDVSQHAVTLANTGPRQEGFCIRIGRHGSVVIGAAATNFDSGLHAVAESSRPLARVWEAAARMMMFYVPETPIHVAIALADPDKGWTDVDRWSALPGPSEADLSGVQREARRARGDAAWEPESTA